jgi:heat shock protein HtpX
MLTTSWNVTLLVTAIAIAPGLVCWWQGRRLKHLTDDAALPERLMAARRVNGATLGAALVLLMGASTDGLWWSVPLMVLWLIVASYPLRKTLFGETWSVTTYVGFVTRLIAGIWGFWILLALTPMLAGLAGSLDWLAAGVLAALLLAWNARYAIVFRRLLRVRPFEDAALLSRFNEMVARSGIPMPRFEDVDLRGGVIANALALPSLKRSSVIFTRTLLERLQPEETVAICAHELAHLEHFNSRRLGQINVVNVLLIASAAAVAPISRLGGLPSSLILQVIWAAAAGGVMVWRARDRQRNETASDLRAVALCGNAEALVSGLTRLYTMARVPRRLDSVTEHRATHPSLARRIRDIRRAAGAVSSSLDTAATLSGADGRAAVTFDNDTLHWHEGEAAIHILSYAHLAELRVDVRGTRSASLIALERSGRRWQLPLAPADVARAQDVLDIVDLSLPAPLPPVPAVLPSINRLVLAFAALVGLVCGQIAMALVTIVALLQPAAPLVAAAGLASLTVAGLLLSHQAASMTELSVVFAAFGTTLLLVAGTKRQEEIPRRAAIAGTLLGALAILSLASIAFGGLDAVRIHQSARSSTAAPVLLLAFAGALASWRSRLARCAAIPVVIAAAATTAAASSSFLDRFGDDPFLAPAASFAWSTVPREPSQQFSVPFSVAILRLSPSGQHVALIASNENAEPEPVTFHVGRAGGDLAPLVADELVFADDEHVLLAQSAGDGIELRQVTAAAPQEILWRLHVPDVIRQNLSLTSASRRWRVMGWDRARQRIVRIEGALGGRTFERAEWPARHSDEGVIHSIASSGADALFVESRYDIGFLNQPSLWRWAWLVWQPDTETRFRAPAVEGISEVAVSRLDARCHAAALGGDDLLCSAFDGTRTRFISIDPASKRIAGVAWLDGQFLALCESPGAWLCGWLDGVPMVVQPRLRTAIRMGADCKDRVTHIAATDRLLGTVSASGNGSTVKLYSLD